MPRRVSIDARSLNGTFVGEIDDDDIACFRNIKYGIIEKRFSRPRIHGDFGGQVVDCVKQGCLCPQATPYVDTLIGIPEERVRSFSLNYDELECLNLMITTPNVPVDSNLPVVVWIHGGGNIAGTPYRGVYDAKNWVKRGIVQGSPFIFVSLSFRVHLFGWLPWEGQGNWSLHDQRLGLEWVHKHIKEFGGDPNKVTLVGQSSGSCDAFMQSVHPAATDYFRQAAYLSGSYRSIRPRGADEYTALAKSIAKHAGTSVNGLRDCPWQKLVEAMSAVGVEVLHPVDDGIFLPVGTYGSPPTSMESIIISDAKEDAYFWSEYLSNDILKSTVGDPQFKSLFHAYGITAMSDLGTVRRSVLEFLTDVIFSVPNHEADKKCRVAGVNVFRQLFDVTNPFTPSLGNNHMVDVIYLFNAYDIPSPKDLAVANIQDRWVKFFNFKEPWEANKAFLVSDSEVKPIAIEDISKHRRLGHINALDDCLLALRNSLGLEGWPPTDAS